MSKLNCRIKKAIISNRIHLNTYILHHYNKERLVRIILNNTTLNIKNFNQIQKNTVSRKRVLQKFIFNSLDKKLNTGKHGDI